jgi:hypothetical protein
VARTKAKMRKKKLECLANSVWEGYKRLQSFREARYNFLSEYSGHYYDNADATTTLGEEPINLIYNAVRVIVPNIVMSNPKAEVIPNRIEYQQYAQLLALALSKLGDDINIKDVFRDFIVDALFGMGILKVGLSVTDSAIQLDDDDFVQLTQPYVERVDLDDFVCSALCRDLKESYFIGHRVRVARASLLDSGLYDSEKIESLPAYQERESGKDQTAESLSKQTSQGDNKKGLQDLVELWEIYIPSEGKIITFAGSEGTDLTPLRTSDYYGPTLGPYVFLRLSPPLPNNPIPIAPVGIWYDLHIRSNAMMKKILEQGESQKNIFVYKRASAADAEEILNSDNNESVGVDDPQAAQVMSFGGVEPNSVQHLSTLLQQFSYMAGNIEQLAGVSSNADTATEASFLQNNANVVVEDMRNTVYDAICHTYRILAWYLHYDPLIDIPMTTRKIVTSETTGFQSVVDENIRLTPEQRMGDFLDYSVKIEAKSLTRMSSQQQLKNTMMFLTNVLPAVANSAMLMSQMGRPFNIQEALKRFGAMLDIEWIDSLFDDPQMLQRLSTMAQMQIQNSKANGGTATGGAASMGAIMQNGGLASAMPDISQGQAVNMGAQTGANEGQSMMRQGGGM